MTTSTNIDFTFDALDKRVIQISAKLMTAGDRLIYARMLNEFKLWKDSPTGYTPVNTTLAVVGCYADESSVRKSLKRLEALDLIVKLPSKPRQACRYIVRTIDEALKVNANLLSLPDMSERRATGMQLEKKGYSHTGKFKKATVLKPEDYGSQTCNTTVLRPVDYGSQTSHERTIKEQEKEFKRSESKNEIVNIESQGLSRDVSLSTKAHSLGESDQTNLNTDDDFHCDMSVSDFEERSVQKGMVPDEDDEPLDDDLLDDEPLDDDLNDYQTSDNPPPRSYPQKTTQEMYRDMFRQNVVNERKAHNPIKTRNDLLTH